MNRRLGKGNGNDPVSCVSFSSTAALCSDNTNMYLTSCRHRLVKKMRPIGSGVTGDRGRCTVAFPICRYTILPYRPCCPRAMSPLFLSLSHPAFFLDRSVMCIYAQACSLTDTQGQARNVKSHGVTSIPSRWRRASGRRSSSDDVMGGTLLILLLRG